MMKNSNATPWHYCKAVSALRCNWAGSWVFRIVLWANGSANMAGKGELLAATLRLTKAGSRNWSANWRRSVANATF